MLFWFSAAAAAAVFSAVQCLLFASTAKMASFYWAALFWFLAFEFNVSTASGTFFYFLKFLLDTLTLKKQCPRLSFSTLVASKCSNTQEWSFFALLFLEANQFNFLGLLENEL